MSDRTIGVRETMANLLRVMRGGGYTDRILDDIESVASATQATRVDYNARSRIRHEIVCDLHAWWPEHDSGTEVVDFEYGVCDAALRIIAARLDGNPTQRAKALSDLLRHFRDRQERLNVSADADRNARVDRIVADMQDRYREDVRAAEMTLGVLRAANDNVPSHVYFITDGEAIKIGKANNPKARLSSLQTSHHRPLYIIAAIPGDETLERELHRTFGEFRIRGEWFKDCAEIRAFVARQTCGKEGSKTPHNAVCNAA